MNTCYFLECPEFCLQMDQVADFFLCTVRSPQLCHSAKCGNMMNIIPSVAVFHH